MIDFNAFHFLRPDWFYGFIPLVLLIVWLYRQHILSSGWQNVLAGHLVKHLVSHSQGKQSKGWLWILAWCWSIALIALAGPTWERLPQPVFQLNTGSVVVVDMSMSMRATDVNPDRLTRAKYKTIDLIGMIDEGDVGLVAYAGDAFTISPLSSDAQNLTVLVPSLSPEIMPVQGSEPFLGLETAATLLKNAGYVDGDIYWITDGVEMSQLAELNEFIEGLPYRISVLGVGTTEGAPIQLVNGDFLKDSRGSIVIPKIRHEPLAALASKGSGKFTTITANDSDITYLVDQALTSRDSESDPKDKQQFGDEWQEAGAYLVILILPFAAYAFRRGILTSVFFVVLLSGAPTDSAYAAWQDWFKNNDQQAKDAFDKQNFDRAADGFDDPLWRGSAHYKAGDFEAAYSAFSQAEGIEADYNLGNTLAKLGNLEEAISAYDKVLDADPEHSDAKTNKQLLEQLKQQQEQQQQEQQQQDQSSSDEQSQDGDDQQSAPQDSENQQSEDSQSSDQQGQPSDSEQPSSEQNGEPQNQQESSDETPAEQESEPQENGQNQEDKNEQDGQQTEENMLGEQQEKPLTDEEREQMQRMQNLLNRVPDDPAYLLKRKMLLENQQRRRQRLPGQSQRSW